MGQKEIKNTSEFYVASFGLKGFRVKTSASLAVSGETYLALFATEDTVLTATNLAGGDNLTSFTLPAGNIIYGTFDDIVVASGTLIAYIA